MAAAKTQRKARLDGIVNGIKRGDYDESIGKIQDALDARKDVLKAEIEARVKEIYGDGYTVTPEKKQNPFLPRAGDIPEGWTPDPDLQGPQIGETTVTDGQPMTVSERERQMEAEIESPNGAVIGPLPEDFVPPATT